MTVQHLSTYRVERMTSSHAVHAISQQLSALPGVRDIHVALDRAEVTVLGDHPLPRETVAAAITAAGYTLASRDGPGPSGHRTA
jgi:copper chaperone CopZ